MQIVLVRYGLVSRKTKQGDFLSSQTPPTTMIVLEISKYKQNSQSNLTRPHTFSLSNKSKSSKKRKKKTFKRERERCSLSAWLSPSLPWLDLDLSKMELMAGFWVQRGEASQWICSTASLSLSLSLSLSTLPVRPVSFFLLGLHGWITPSF